MINGSKRPLGGPRTGRKPSNEQLVLGAVGQEIPAKACCNSAHPNGKHAGGRPTKRTPEITALIAEAISFGLTDEEAAALVGIDDDTLTQWKKIPEFSGAIKRALATRKLARPKRIEAGETGWQGTAWALERQFPERFARPEIQLNLGRASADSQKREDLLMWLRKEQPFVREIVESAPEARNRESEATGTNHRLSPSVEDLDLSFDP
jgi:hypothetical protein